ncbi:serine protease [Mesorhizobium sp. LSHC422A00]|nr:serine protease [Mesorhizobium sp. LSHC426A00]ESX56793.1 serine protease [Mesorhizobium sp. LSHC422A00]ESX58497.1 serine protease [Mesorhizobium sp. LSHC424B00]ESX71909.1 serine protease [Mesorhizobium sp. LSHC416B00]ESX78293.1 serine protease [Mesorhizobium sp. LSHC414A00]
MARGGNVHFVRSTSARAVDVLAVAGKPLWHDCETAFARIDELCGDNTSRLFAEPNAKEQEGGRLVVAWFSSFDEEPKQLGELDRGKRSRIESNLAARIEALRPALADREIGGTVGAMLNVADEASIVAVGENAVLTNWGVLPEEARSSRAAFVRHSEQTIGPYLPSGMSPRVPGQAWAALGGFATAGLSPPRRVIAPEATAASTQEAQSTAPARHKQSWLWPIAALSLVFAACLIYAASPGNLVYPEALPPPPTAPLVNNEEVNRSLEERIGKMKRELAKAACEADSSVLGPPLHESGGGTENGASGAARGQAPAPGSPHSLLAALDSATVLVLAPSADSLSTGSGFFVSQREILTNNHVVEGAGGTVFVASKALGRAVPARVVARSASSETGNPDFALLRVDDAPSTVRPLHLSTEIARLDSVIAGGFPSFVMSMDSTYRAILNGDTTGLANLEMVVTQGNVMAMPQGGAAKVITHSANISPGNSGGPLSDACGRAVGVNTFIVLDGGNVQKLNFSLGASDAIRFLSANGVTVAGADQPCNPATGIAAAAGPTEGPVK